MLLFVFFNVLKAGKLRIYAFMYFENVVSEGTAEPGASSTFYSSTGSALGQPAGRESGPRATATQTCDMGLRVLKDGLWVRP